MTIIYNLYISYTDDFQDFERGKIADVMESKKYKENDIIIKQVDQH